MNFICIMKQITDTEESASQLAKQVDYVMGLHKFQGRQPQSGFSTSQQKCTKYVLLSTGYATFTPTETESDIETDKKWLVWNYV